ncbi:uncharacterized protein LOC130991574 [Salvia miltiorrhiza]|uniref:uncharacterized protein LOC130991574 n=1 Tax=Salvia miltiorrhiza TaxID=226208 RepID=UPI0025ACABB1|nr:uncharacterized protein LOC130991574 [Salvia miltiorrhiza]
MNDKSSPRESQGSVHLQIFELNTASSLEPQGGGTAAADSARAPEKQLTLFALRLAVLEKTASGIGTLGFIWATVVLLGGFAITLDKTDFWFITIILLIEGTRIFSRSHELELQHQATWSLTEAGITIRSGSNLLINTVRSAFTRSVGITVHRTREPALSRPITRTWTSSEVPLLSYGRWMFISRNVSRVLHWLQLASAVSCVALSMIKLVHRDFGEMEKDNADKRNRESALIIFYSLALAEALLFLLEKAYWEWKLSFDSLLESVNKECELGDSGLISIRRFFYDAYSKCVNGSVFDGLKMDMVSFAMELLSSNSPDEQLIGARILRRFATSSRFSQDTLQKIGINLGVVERLVEMLNWKDIEEEEIRYSAAEILSNLASKRHNSLRIAGIAGALESISSLLRRSRGHGGVSDQISEKRAMLMRRKWSFNNLGLEILKKLARDHDICGKIGNTKGLLAKIVEFLHADEELLRGPASEIVTVKRSLQVVKMLAAAGRELRREISEMVLTIGYIRDVLRYGDRHPELQILGIEILTSLAVEEDATERIGGTGGVVRELFNIFFKEGAAAEELRGAAGEAIAMLALESENTCRGMLKLRMKERLIAAVESPLLRVNAARILRNLCAYSGNDCFHHLKELTAAAPTILEAIMREEGKLQEVMMGAASCMFKLMDKEESRSMFERVGVRERELANRVVWTLDRYEQPCIKVPSMRRYAIELAMWMMREERGSARVFRGLGMARRLESVTETTSELESFNIFCGTVGLCRHKLTMHALVEAAMKQLEEGCCDHD